MTLPLAPAAERPDDIERDVPVYLPPDAEWDVELELEWDEDGVTEGAERCLHSSPS